MKTSDLTGSALDWAVARSLGIPAEEIRVNWMGVFRNLRDEDGNLRDGYMTGPDLLFSRKWEAGGPIIDLERISIRTYAAPGRNWVAFIDCGGSSISGAKARQVGPTALVAAMRCFVASKLGDTVELPKELQ